MITGVQALKACNWIYNFQYIWTLRQHIVTSNTTRNIFEPCVPCAKFWTRFWKVQSQTWTKTSSIVVRVKRTVFDNCVVYFLSQAVSMGELYGEINKLTMEWRDGLMAITVRVCVQVWSITQTVTLSLFPTVLDKSFKTEQLKAPVKKACAQTFALGLVGGLESGYHFSVETSLPSLPQAMRFIHG